MKIWIFILGIILAGNNLYAQTNVWQPSLGHVQIPIWAGVIPDAQPALGPESMTTSKSLVAGRSWGAVENVSLPTMTVYSPKGTNTGVAVVIFPGGGYRVLAMDLEGTEVCDWLTSQGITAVLLKYRVPFTGPHWDEACKCQLYPKAPMALEDAQRTVSLVRFHAPEWQVDPHKIGVLGFSAGGHLAAAMATRFGQRLYPASDAVDQTSCRPNFSVSLYPGHLWLDEEKFELNPEIATNIDRQTPPVFLLQNEDDNVDGVEQSLVYYLGLKKAGVPVEMHLYAQGGHGFGLRHTKLPVTAWPRLVETWLGTIGMFAQPAASP